MYYSNATPTGIIARGRAAVHYSKHRNTGHLLETHEVLMLCTKPVQDTARWLLLKRQGKHEGKQANGGYHGVWLGVLACKHSVA